MIYVSFIPSLRTLIYSFPLKRTRSAPNQLLYCVTEVLQQYNALSRVNILPPWPNYVFIPFKAYNNLHGYPGHRCCGNNIRTPHYAPTRTHWKFFQQAEKAFFFHTFSSSNLNSSKQQSQNWIKLTMAVSCLVWITFIKTLWSSLKYTVLTCGEIIGVLTMSLIWESLLPLSVWEVRAWSGALESLIDGACLVNRPNHETSAVNGDVADGYRCTPIGSPAHY